MKPLVFIIGLILLVFGFYPPLSMPTLILGLIVTLIGLFTKGKKDK